MSKKKIAVVFGTRPEAIKMAPVIKELQKYPVLFETIIIATGQHREMLDQVINVFSIVPHYDLNIMKDNQSLSTITADVLTGMERIFIKEKPDMVLVHGDTTTSFSAALAAFYQKISIGHVEAGLRTYDKYSPYPEEANRMLIDSITDVYFVPTEVTKQNLINEGKDESKIIVTGNSVIDAIKMTNKMKITHPVLELMDKRKEQKWIIVTAHRRENYGQPLINIFKAILELTKRNPTIEFLIPVHLSPLVQKMSKEILTGESRVHLIEPLDVSVFHQVVGRSHIVLTDSGGLQEEAPALNKPVLVLRDKTERPEGVSAGTLKVIGTEEETIVREVTSLLSDDKLYNKMSKAVNPYGDGETSKQIVEFISDYGGYYDK